MLRCALVALGLPPSGTARLLWKSGDMVDFGKPITDGVTLHLEIAHAAPAPHHDGGGSFYSARGGGGVPSGFGGHVAGFRAGAQRRVGSSTTPAGGGGAVDAPRGAPITDSDRQRGRRRLPRPDPSESSLAKRRALLTVRRFFGVSSGSGSGSGSSGSGSGRGRGFLSSFLERTMPSPDSDGEQERRPLLGITRSSSSTSLLSPSSSSSTSGGGARGRGERGADEVDGDGDNPDHQRSAILKLKRINAHLANERTLLAWVRCVGKMFTAGVLSLSLAAATGDRTYATCFAAMGMVYFAMGPYVVFVGASRCVIGRRSHTSVVAVRSAFALAFLYVAGFCCCRGMISIGRLSQTARNLVN